MQSQVTVFNHSYQSWACVNDAKTGGGWGKGEWGGRGVGREERNRVVGVREGGSTGRSCLCGCFWKETNAD